MLLLCVIKPRWGPVVSRKSIWGPVQQPLFPENLVTLSSGDKANPTLCSYIICMQKNCKAPWVSPSDTKSSPCRSSWPCHVLLSPSAMTLLGCWCDLSSHQLTHQGASLIARLQLGDPSSIPGSGRSAGEGIGYPLQYSWASLVAQLVKNSPAMQETWVLSLGWEDPLEKGKATHSSILAWRIPWTV